MLPKRDGRQLLTAQTVCVVKVASSIMDGATIRMSKSRTDYFYAKFQS